jgi:hypothetical protein
MEKQLSQVTATEFIQMIGLSVSDGMKTVLQEQIGTKEFSQAIGSSVSDGMRTALQDQLGNMYNQADHNALLKQHESQTTGQQKKDSVESKMGDISEKLAQLREYTEAHKQEVEETKNLFESMSRMISDMTLPTLESVRQMSTSSGLVSQATAPVSNEMTLSSNVPMQQNGVGGAIKNFSSYGNAIASQPVVPVESSSLYQQAISSTGADLEKNTASNDRKMLIEEEDRVYKSSIVALIPKLNQAIDKYLEGKPTSGGSGDGESLLDMLGLIGGGIAGFAMGYVSKFASMWKEIGSAFGNVMKSAWNSIKESKVGKTIAKWGKQLKSTISNSIKSSIQDIVDLKSSFTKMLDGWKASMKDSTLGKLVHGVTESVVNAGKNLGSLASKAKNKISGALTSAKDAIAGLAKTAGTKIAKSSVAQRALTAAKIGMKFAKKIPHVQAVMGGLDNMANMYGMYKNNAGLTDIINTGAAGAIDTLADMLMVPELVNGVGGAIAAAQSGKGLGGIAKGFGSGVMTERDDNDIGIGHGFIANLQNLVGNDTETSRRVADAYNRGVGYKEAGLETVTGAAAGFGHSAAMYVSKAAGSLENSKTPTAKVTEELPDGGQMSEADKMKAYADGVKEGVKEALLSPEVQEANAMNAQATGAAINGSLFGG